MYFRNISKVPDSDTPKIQIISFSKSSDKKPVSPIQPVETLVFRLWRPSKCI